MLRNYTGSLDIQYVMYHNWRMGRKRRPSSSQFGTLVREQRDKLGLTTADLATILSCSQSFVEFLESGRRGCDLNDLPRIADALHLEARGVVQIYLRERHPQIFAVLFQDVE